MSFITLQKELQKIGIDEVLHLSALPANRQVMEKRGLYGVPCQQCQGEEKIVLASSLLEISCTRCTNAPYPGMENGVLQDLIEKDAQTIERLHLEEELVRLQEERNLFLDHLGSSVLRALEEQKEPLNIMRITAKVGFPYPLIKMILKRLLDQSFVTQSKNDEWIFNKAGIERHLQKSAVSYT
jgi:hypothetical protein